MREISLCLFFCRIKFILQYPSQWIQFLAKGTPGNGPIIELGQLSKILFFKLYSYFRLRFLLSDYCLIYGSSSCFSRLFSQPITHNELNSDIQVLSSDIIALSLHSLWLYPLSHPRIKEICKMEKVSVFFLPCFSE